MSRKRLLLAAAFLLPVLAAILVLLADIIGGHPSTVVLADGRLLTVRGISSGTSHRFVYGNLWQRLAALVLPDRWSQKLGAVTYRQMTGHQAYVVWVELGPTAGASVSRVWLADEAGTFIPAFGLRTSSTTDNNIRPYMFFTMPTGSRQVEVMADLGYDPDDLGSMANRRKVGGAVRFRNPSYLRHPEWRGTPPPIVIEQDELRLHVDYFGPSREKLLWFRDQKNEAGPGGAKDDGLPLTERRSRTELACRIHDPSNPTNEWSINHVGIVNEVGSEWVPGSQVRGATTTNTLLRFTGRLATNSLWKLRLYLTRPPTPDLDKLTTRPLPYERTIELIAQPTAAPMEAEKSSALKELNSPKASAH